MVLRCTEQFFFLLSLVQLFFLLLLLLLLLAIAVVLARLFSEFFSGGTKGSIQNCVASFPATVQVGTNRAERIPRAEVARHNTKLDCWIVVHHLVLDVTHYIPVHPGGESFLTNNAGKDASNSFDTVHDLQDLELYAPEVIIGVTAD